MPTNTREYDRAYKKKYRAALKAKGLCVRCAKASRPGKTICAGCNAWCAKEIAKWRAKRKAKDSAKGTAEESRTKDERQGEDDA